MSSTSNGRRPFKRVVDNKWFKGVCGGIAYTFAVPALFVRIITIIALIVGSNEYVDYIGSAVFLGYLLAWWLAPKWDTDPTDYDTRTA